MFFCLAATPLSAGPVHDAVRHRDAGALRALLQQDPSLSNAATEDGVTPIHIAASLDDPDIVSLLIEAGAKVNAKTANGATPLHWAAMAKAEKATEIPIRKGANVRATTSEGLTALQAASQKGAAKVVQLLTSAESALQAGILADPRFVEGRQALAGGDTQRAQDIFMDLLREHPESIDVNFALGEAAYAAGKYSHAALALERIVASQPENHRARLELARTYFSAKQLELARREFETVLAHNPPETVRMKIKDFLEAIRKQEKKFWFSGRLDAGLYYDDNGNVGPDSEVINIAPIIVGGGTISSLTVSDQSVPVKSWGALLYGTVSSCYDIGRKGHWMLVCDGAAYRSWLEKHATDEETFYLSVGPGICWVGENCIVRIPARVSHITHGGESLVNSYGLTPSVSMSIGPERTWYYMLTALVESRDYTDLQDRNGSYYAAGGKIGRSFSTYQCSIFGGAAAFYENTASDVYESTGAEVFVGGEMLLPWTMAGYAQAKYRGASYAEKEVLAPEKRRDDQYQLTVGLRRALTRRSGVDLSYQYTRNASSFDLYEYSRNFASLSMSYSF